MGTTCQGITGCGTTCNDGEVARHAASDSLKSAAVVACGRSYVLPASSRRPASSRNCARPRAHSSSQTRCSARARARHSAPAPSCACSCCCGVSALVVGCHPRESGRRGLSVGGGRPRACTTASSLGGRRSSAFLIGLRKPACRRKRAYDYDYERGEGGCQNNRFDHQGQVDGVPGPWRGSASRGALLSLR